MAKASPSGYTSLLQSIRADAPGEHQGADLPLRISQERAEAMLHVVHDLGGQPDGPLDKSLHTPTHWEKCTHSTAECLAWRGVWVAEERRRRENDLEQEAILFRYPLLCALAARTTKLPPIRQGPSSIAPDELLEKMEEVGTGRGRRHRQVQCRRPGHDPRPAALFHTRTQGYARGRTGECGNYARVPNG